MSVPRHYHYLHAVAGTLQQTQVVVYRHESEMFKDPARLAIVDLSLSANNDFLSASIMAENDPRRAALLQTAIAKRLDEKRQWLEMQPPDVLGAFQADLALASYHNQAGDMVKSFDFLMEIRAGAPSGSMVYQMALKNLMAMRETTSVFFRGAVWSDPATTDELGRLRQFWVQYMALPDE